MKNILTILFLLISVCAQGYSDSFIEYIKYSENSVKDGFINGLWYPHESIEGGVKTIAYGHKIKSNEDFSNGLTETEAHNLLIKDLNHAERLAASFIEKKGFGWSELPEWKREVFIDFQFNGVLRSFPKFVKAVLCDDVAGMVKEYKRYAKTSNGQRIELKDRNSRLHDRYLVPLGINREKE
jgi:GH24 family phage-related lysozyme (muramidase)